MSTGIASCKVNRTTGEVLSIGYVNPETKWSEATAEVAYANASNTDPEVGFVELRIEPVQQTPDVTSVLRTIRWCSERNYLGFNNVLGGGQ